MHKAFAAQSVKTWAGIVFRNCLFSGVLRIAAQFRAAAFALATASWPSKKSGHSQKSAVAAG
jgi:hypothetical protein